MSVKLVKNVALACYLLMSVYRKGTTEVEKYKEGPSQHTTIHRHHSLSEDGIRLSRI